MKTHHRLCPYRPATHTDCDHYSDHPLGNPYAQTRCAVAHFSPEIPCQCDLVLKVEADTVDRAVDALTRAASAGRLALGPSEWTHTATAVSEILRCKQAA